jgi:archaemetzincin
MMSHGSKKKSMIKKQIICIIILLFAGIFFQYSSDLKQVEMKNNIYLVPIGEIEDQVLAVLQKHLEKEFRCKVEVAERMEIPRDAYNKGRNQYLSTNILEKIRSLHTAAEKEKALAISKEDLYVKGLNFVFGEAELGGQYAIISLARLHQSFYGLPEEETLFLERAIKEAVHELGHVYGLRHCPNPECVMHFSNSLTDTDRKSSSFCRNCQAILDKLIVRQ